MPLPDSNRIDLSQHLIHFTKPGGGADALEVLLKILRERRLLGSADLVKGGTPCVSFTEAPFDVLAAGFNGPKGYSRYSAIGLRFPKTHVFRAGGRPVIYQPNAEYDRLPGDLRWRHVRFEPLGEATIDWTWEREWRLPCEEFPFAEKEVEVVLPDARTEEQFIRRVEDESFHHAWQLTQVLGEVAWAYHNPNQWRILKPKAAEATPR